MPASHATGRTSLPWERVLHIAAKDVRIYYLKGPNLTFGLLLLAILYGIYAMGGDVTPAAIAPGMIAAVLSAREHAVYEAFAKHLYDRGVRTKIDEAGYPVLDGEDVSGVLDTMDEAHMPLLIEAVKRLQELQG